MASWKARLAAYKSRSVPDDDPHVVKCYAGLDYWSYKKLADEAVASGLITKDFADAALAKARQYEQPAPRYGPRETVAH